MSKATKLYELAKQKFCTENYNAVLEIIADYESQVTKNLHHSRQLSFDLNWLKADTLFELGHLKQAEDLYKELGLLTHRAYAVLLQERLQEAQNLYLQSEFSAAKKWGVFISELFLRPNELKIGPGFLAFRAFFELTYGYCLRFDKEDLVAIFDFKSKDLIKFYPEYDQDREKVRAVLQKEKTN